MASDEQLKLSTFIKNVHNNLRQKSKEKGAEEAWNEHVQQEDILKTYADSMKKLALMWDNNNLQSQQTITKSNKQCSKRSRSRVTWIIDYCHSYFKNENILIEKRLKELQILNLCYHIVDPAKYNNRYLTDASKLNVLDVGSCFNPFKVVHSFNVTAIDLYPQNDDVYKADFLKVNTNIFNELTYEDREITSLPIQYFHCIVFSLLLEYIPTSKQRILCCLKAYELLKYEGILIIITPDSQHVGKNAKLMKNWRYTLTTIGFSRIKFEKLSHITCMVFRKSVSKQICKRWADLHKEDYMNLCLDIPQDS